MLIGPSRCQATIRSGAPPNEWIRQLAIGYIRLLASSFETALDRFLQYPQALFHLISPDVQGGENPYRVSLGLSHEQAFAQAIVADTGCHLLIT